MRNIKDMVKAPIFFERNRVYRVYTGGKQLDAMQGKQAEDGFFPEEWLASAVKAINPRYFGERDGVSVVEGTDIFFDDLLKAEGEALTGGREYDCLVKFLDSEIRLPVQVHPTPEFAMEKFGSRYGKTESWLVLNTRNANAGLYFGFKESIDKKFLSKLEERSLTEKDIMQSALSYVKVKPGDVFLIRAGLIHAIGAGCTILEVQEPTDFTIQPENWCGDYRISEEEKYIGLAKDTALDCFDYSLFGKRAIESAKMTPRTAEERTDYKKEILIDYEDTPCFSVVRHILKNGETVMQNAPSVWAVVSGEATIIGRDYRRIISCGDYFFLPYAAVGNYTVYGDAVLIECLPSKRS